MSHEHPDMHSKSKEGKDYYTCPMHPEIKQDKPGTCPKCGRMELVKKSALDSGEAHHDHASMPVPHTCAAAVMASPEATADFLRRFFIVTALLVPLAVFSELAVKFLGTPDFGLRPLLEFGIGTLIFYFGLVFFQHARHEIMARQYGMMTLVSLGVGAGYFFSAASTFIPAIQTEFYLEISTLIWVLLFGHFLEAKSSTAAGDALQEVAKLLPKEAHLVRSKNLEVRSKDVAIDQLQEGDVVLVKPGEKVPADGEIIKGEGNFNEAHLTGESKPVAKTVGIQVVAGAINIDGSVEVRLKRVGESSTIGQIQNLIAAAKQTKPSVQKLADRASRWLTFTALAVAFTALIVWSLVVGQPLVFAATLAITVLVIACPHALGLAIPTVSTIATKLAVTNGVFIKDMAKIEVIKDADYVVFDKTGTLTRGEFALSRFEFMENLPAARKNLYPQPYRKLSFKDYLKTLVLSLESHSSHPVAQPVVAELARQNLPRLSVKQFKNYGGKGIGGVVNNHQALIGTKRFLTEQKVIFCAHLDPETQKWAKAGETIAYVAVDGKHLASFSVSDQVKPEAKVAVKQLHELGVKVAMLTGDIPQVASDVAKKLGIDTVFAQVLPEDKYKYIRQLQDKGNVVIMAGDGVNDAPALTQANAGVAIGAGTDVAVEAGDIVLTQSNPQHLVRLIVLSRKVYRKMVENLVWAVGYNVLAIPAAAGLFIPLGFRLTPAIGALLMSLSSVIVVINAMTLRKAKLAVR